MQCSFIKEILERLSRCHLNCGKQAEVNHGEQDSNYSHMKQT